MENAVSLAAACKHFGTDKFEKGFADFYERSFEEFTPQSILELGVKNGASLRAFKAFWPNAEIEGWDWAPAQIPGIFTTRVDCGSRTEMLSASAGKKWDVIIDDAGHKMSHQQSAMSALFSKCKFFIMEDLHTSWIEKYLDSDGRTTFELVVNLGPGGLPWNSPWGSAEESEFITTNGVLRALRFIGGTSRPRFASAIIENMAWDC